MCWISKKLDKKIATENMTVYKLVKFDTFNTCRSLIYDYKYTFEKLYKLKHPLVCKEWSDAYIINEGFHSYANLRTMRFAEDMIKGCIAECTIPKGATYYISSFGRMVSDQIIIHIPTILSDIKQFLKNSK